MKNISNLNNLEVLKFDNQNFNSKWYEFLVNYSMYTMRYDLDYHNVEKSQSFNKYLDLSFIILNNDEPLAIIPFVLDLNNLYAWYREGHFMPAPLINENLSPKQIKVLENLIFKEVQQIISKYKITRWYIDADSLSFKKFNYFDLLPDKFLCTDMSFYNRIIDLDYDPSAIWKQIRKSYRNIITQGLRYFSFEIYDHTNFDGDPNKTYMKLHRKTSKKIPITGNAGDLIIWDSRLWHGTLENYAKRSRWAIVTTLSSWWVKQAMDMTKSLPRKIYSKCSKQQKQLLGFCSIPPKNEYLRINTKCGYEVLK